MRVLVVEPERRPEVKEIDDSLKEMQGIVGGYIQSIYPFEEPVALVCNDEGKLMDLPANRGLRDENGQIYDIVFGTFFLCDKHMEIVVSDWEPTANYLMCQGRNTAIGGDADGKET